MTQPPDTAAQDYGPIVAAAYSAAGAGLVPPARAITRTLPLEQGRERTVLAVAEGIGDAPSAEAQAAEALGRLEATAARAARGASAREILLDGYVVADTAIARLLRLPGSVEGAGAAMVAAVVEDGRAFVANLGSTAAFLVAPGSQDVPGGVRRLTGPSREPRGGATRPGGAAGPAGALLGSAFAEPNIIGPVLLAQGDTLLLCSDAVAQGLGEKVIEAAVQEYGIGRTAQQLTRIATEHFGRGGAAAALYHVHDPSAPDAAAPAAGAAEQRKRRRPWRDAAVVAAAILLGAAATTGIIVAATRSGGEKKAPSTAGATVARTTPAATEPPPAATPTPPAATTPVPSTAPPTIGAQSPGGTPPAAPSRATPPPLALSALPACSSSGPSCAYTAQAGDSLSLIGDRFSVTRACFEAANRDHDPVAPSAANDDRIGAGEAYIIPDTAGCAALTVAGAAPRPTVSVPAPVPPTAGPVCTPVPGASAPSPFCR